MTLRTRPRTKPLNEFTRRLNRLERELEDLWRALETERQNRVDADGTHESIFHSDDARHIPF